MPTAQCPKLVTVLAKTSLNLTNLSCNQLSCFFAMMTRLRPDMHALVADVSPSVVGPLSVPCVISRKPKTKQDIAENMYRSWHRWFCCRIQIQIIPQTPPPVGRCLVSDVQKYVQVLPWYVCQPSATVRNLLLTLVVPRCVDHATFNDLEWPLTQKSKSCHYLTLNVSEMVRNRDVFTMEY